MRRTQSKLHQRETQSQAHNRSPDRGQPAFQNYSQEVTRQKQQAEGLQQTPNVEADSLTLSWQNWSSKQSWHVRRSCAWAGSPAGWRRVSQTRTAGHQHGLPLPSLGRWACGTAGRTGSCMSWHSWGNKVDLLSRCESGAEEGTWIHNHAPDTGRARDSALEDAHTHLRGALRRKHLAI